MLFDNLHAKPACRSVFLISDPENVLKAFQQNIITEVEKAGSVTNSGLLPCIYSISLFSSSGTPKFRHLE